MQKPFRNLLIPFASMAFLIFSVYHLMYASEERSKVPPLVEPPQGAATSSICGTGIVEARSENICVGAAVSGLVLEVYVTHANVGYPIYKGDPLFRVDDRHLKAQLKVQQANLRAAEAELGRLQQQPRIESLPPAASKVNAADAHYQKLKDQCDRAEPLFLRKIIPAEEFTAKKFSLLEAEHQLRQAEAEEALLKAGAWQPDKEVSQSAIEIARANIEQTETEIERCLVRAPVDGQILKIDVRPGEYVNTASNRALILLGDLSQLHIRVDIDEQDIALFRPTARATAVARGATLLSHELKFVRVEPYVIPKKSLTGDSTERIDTRVLQVVYSLQSGDENIYVGQQLDVFIE